MSAGPSILSGSAEASLRHVGDGHRSDGVTRSLPDHVFLRLELLDERRFVSGVVLHYGTTP
jgi:hypothetical protein